jgi:hypothetical protein
MPPKVLTPEQVFSVFEDWLAITGQPPPAIESSSPLAGDAAKSPQHRVDHAAWSAIAHAIDHLHAVKALVIDARKLHPYAPYSLLRAAIENAATAVWLLEPSDRSTRLERCLRLAYNEAAESGNARELIPKAFEGKRTAEERKAEIKTLAKSLGLNVGYVCGGFYYSTVVKQAGEAAQLGREAELMWRICSGFAHGRQWASLGVLERAVRESSEDAVSLLQLTTTLEQLALCAQVPLALTNDALHLFDRRRQSPYAGTPLL